MFGYQIATMDVNYTYNDGETTDEVNVNLTNDNPFIVELSLGMKLAFLGLHVSASYADLLSASVGLGLHF